MLKTYFTYLTIVVVLFSSCASKKDILYLQDIEKYEASNDSTFNDIRIQKNDLLSIIVSSTDQQSSLPFNLPVVSSSSGGNLTVTSNQRIQTYLVSENGFIDFPVLGSIEVLGKTKEEIISFLKEELLKYIKDPIVTLRITNFNISILGEVNRPGTYLVSNERINIFQAISLAGDLTVLGKRKDILVIREKDGKKTYNKIDFTSKETLVSPYYYLHQNDVIMVSPNRAQVQSSAFNRNTSVWVSIAGVVLSVISILTR